MKYRTFKAWSERGFKILKGSKSSKRNKEGVCLFSEKQVEKKHFEYDDEYERELDDHYMMDRVY